MSLNKNISVWRGNQSPPTKFHIWIKDNGDEYINIDEEYVLKNSKNLGDTINITSILNNQPITQQEAFNWVATDGLTNLKVQLHIGNKIKFKDSDDNLWKEFLYTSNTIDSENLKNTNNWELISKQGFQQDVESKIDRLKIVSISPISDTILASYELRNKDNIKLGDTINIPKDTSIKDVQIKDTNATIDSNGNILDGNPKGSTALCIVYILNTGEYKLVKLDYQSFLEEKEISDGLEVNNNLLKVKIDPKSEKFISVSSNGVKINGIQNTVSRVDSIWNGNPQLVTPQLSGNWTVYKQDNSVVTPTPSFPLEYGYKAKFSGTWKWVETSGKKPPESTTGAWGTSIPESNVNSQQFTSPNYVTSNTTYSQTIYAAKKGLMVSGQDVVPAKGNDSKSISTSISFSNRIYYGASNSKIPTESIIKSLNSKLGGRSNTINGVLTNSNQYYYYAYPKSLGNLSTIIQDGATPILGAFTLNTSLIITNNAGLQIPMNVYVSNNPGSFTNNNIKFE